LIEIFKVLLPSGPYVAGSGGGRDGNLAEGRWSNVKIEAKQDRLTPVAIVKGS
jgi:hypothetical protein